MPIIALFSVLAYITVGIFNDADICFFIYDLIVIFSNIYKVNYATTIIGCTIIRCILSNAMILYIAFDLIHLITVHLMIVAV